MSGAADGRQVGAGRVVYKQGEGWRKGASVNKMDGDRDQLEAQRCDLHHQRVCELRTVVGLEWRDIKSASSVNRILSRFFQVKYILSEKNYLERNFKTHHYDYQIKGHDLDEQGQGR